MSLGNTEKDLFAKEGRVEPLLSPSTVALLTCAKYSFSCAGARCQMARSHPGKVLSQECKIELSVLVQVFCTP